MGRQMEGDNQRRRALARQARRRGRRPSEVGATLGADKQIESLDKGRRDGPQPIGSRKPNTERGGPGTPPPATAERPMPLPDGSAPGATGVITYRELVSDVGRRAGVDFARARAAAEATVTVLARALDVADRQRLLDAVPGQLCDGEALETGARRRDLAGFLSEVARLTHGTPEQARYQAQATLGALAARDRGLIESLDLPEDLRDLLGPPSTGGGLVDPSGATAALTEDELREALAGLPYWSGDGDRLTRTIELPAENLDRVLGRLARLRPETGRGPSVGRPSPTTAVITVRTRGLGGVSALDVELAHDIDDAIEEAAAGLAGP
jgi:Pterin-4a-carbinolamine dehydratase